MSERRYRRVAAGLRGSDSDVGALRAVGAPCAEAVSADIHPRRATFRILVVDDDDLVREMLIGLLRHSGHEVDSARNGAEAVECVARCEEFNLILLDVQMPVLDGWATIRELHARGCRTPIVVMSGHATESEVPPGRVAGFLTKPFDHAHLVDVVEHLAMRSSG